MPMPEERDGAIIFRASPMEQEKVNQKKKDRAEYAKLKETVRSQGEEINSLRTALFKLDIKLQEFINEKDNS